MKFPVEASHVDMPGGNWRPPRHNAVDIFAARGADVVAPESGRAVWGNGATLSGNFAHLYSRDGKRRWLFAHMDAPHTGAMTADVSEGTPLGAVGTSGSARGKTPHVHVELRHRDSRGQFTLAVNPRPVLLPLMHGGAAVVPSVKEADATVFSELDRIITEYLSRVFDAIPASMRGSPEWASIEREAGILRAWVRRNQALRAHDPEGARRDATRLIRQLVLLDRLIAENLPQWSGTLASLRRSILSTAKEISDAVSIGYHAAMDTGKLLLYILVALFFLR